MCIISPIRLFKYPPITINTNLVNSDNDYKLHIIRLDHLIMTFFIKLSMI